jgi:hypothetical protein
MLTLLYILEFVQLQIFGTPTAHTSPFIVWPVVIALLIITILAIRVYIIDKRKAQ